MTHIIPDLKDGSIVELLEKAVQQFRNMSDEERAIHVEEQRKSFVIGQLMLSHPEMTQDAAVSLYNRANERLKGKVE